MNHFRKSLIVHIYIYIYIYNYIYVYVYFMIFYTFLLALLVSEDDACCWEAARVSERSERSEPWPYDPDWKTSLWRTKDA